MRTTIRYELAVGLVRMAVDRLHGVEELGRPHRFEMSSRVDRADETLVDALVRAPVSIVLIDDGGAQERHIEGVVTDVAIGIAGTESSVRLIVESTWAVARFNTDMRVFRNQSTVDIVRELFELRGVRVESRLRGSYPARHQTVQLRENDLDFALRLLEEEGITAYEQPDKLVVLADELAGWQPWSGPPLPFVPGGALERAGEAIVEISERAELGPAKVVARDFTRARPRVPVQAATDVGLAGASGTRHLWLRGPAERRDPERAARIGAEAVAVECSSIELLIASVRAAPGQLIRIEGLPDASLPEHVLITRVEHRLDDGVAAPGLRAHALPREQPYRPQRRTPRPIQEGPLVAFVTGPQHAGDAEGADVFTDALGQVKIRYPWDRRQPPDARASDWVPVMQDQTGQSCAIPRVGWEVLVHYLEGDPDRPVVLGRLYNGGDTFPEPLPAAKTVSAIRSQSSPNGGGKNMIRIDDAAGTERIDVHAERDQTVVVENNEQRDVGVDRSREIAGSERTAIAGDDKALVAGDADLVVGKDAALTVGGRRSTWIGASEAVSTVGDHTLEIAGAHLRRIGRADIVEAGSLEERVAGVHCELALRNVTLSSKRMVTTIVGGASVGIAAKGHKSSTKLARGEAIGAISLSRSALDTTIHAKGDHDLRVGGAFIASAGTSAEITGPVVELDTNGPFNLEGATSLTLRVGDTEVVIADGTMVVYAKKLLVDGASKLAWAEASITG